MRWEQRWGFLGLLGVIAIVFVALFVFLPRDLGMALAVTALVAFLYFGIAAGLTRYGHRLPAWLDSVPLWAIVAVPVTLGLVLLFRFWTSASLVTAVFLLGMLFVFLYYWLIVPFAVVQKLGQEGWSRPLDEYPPISLLVPAYNEEGYLDLTLDSIAAAEYPAAVELIVIDDGSLDGTAEEARSHPGTDATVIQKDNGGKHSALNAGIEAATHDVIVSVDADSWIAPDALANLVTRLVRSPNAGAVAGNVKVGNRGTFITNLQALEYVVGINTFRRAFDHVGLVSVVPGCLGAFRRETLEEIRGYSPDTLTEDFDLTIEILKRGRAVHMSEGVVYTAAPTTWRGLYRQRLRWFRGHVQTLVKHANVFGDTQYGLLHRLVFPYALLSMSLFPLLGVAITFLIPLAVLVGEGWLVAQIAVFFFVLLALLSLIAIEIDGEKRRLVLYAPLSVVGYKQFLDCILFKAVYDVLRKRELGWTFAGRPERLDSEVLEYDPSAPRIDVEEHSPTEAPATSQSVRDRS